MHFNDFLFSFFLTPLKLSADLVECFLCRLFPAFPHSGKPLFIILSAAAVLLLSAAVIFLMKQLRKPEEKGPLLSGLRCFLSEEAVLTLLFGAMIPSTLIASSAVEFQSTHYGPMMLVLSTFLSWSGTFLFYGTLIYLVCGKPVKKF